MEMSLIEGQEDDITEGMTENDYTQNKSGLGMNFKSNISKTPISMGFKNSDGNSKRRRDSQKSFKSSVLDSDMIPERPDQTTSPRIKEIRQVKKANIPRINDT